MNTPVAMTRNAVLLGAFAALTAALIAWTWLSTEEDIAQAVRAAEARQLLEIFPEASHDNVLLDDTFPVPARTPLLDNREDRRGYRARKDDAVVGIILPATARDGYSGDIRMLVGVRSNGQLAGVRVISHRETPGLGDAIDLKKSPWVLAFTDKSLTDPLADAWAVKKDGGEFDQFTGATITPRAVVTATRKVLEYVELNQATLFITAENKLPANDGNAEEGKPGNTESTNASFDSDDNRADLLNNAEPADSAELAGTLSTFTEQHGS